MLFGLNTNQRKLKITSAVDTLTYMDKKIKKRGGNDLLRFRYVHEGLSIVGNKRLVDGGDGSVRVRSRDDNGDLDF